ncbi:MAG TPA: tetratricopeptide repeat protein, partial [Candidatus Polarisedimenticolia bacterium]|nr:tetratricopeptide repeat protein [Candidatus Polarisedimenticolia bacterium]
MRLWSAVAAAALLVLGAEASVRDLPPRAARAPSPAPASAADRAGRLAQARDEVARAEAEFGATSPEVARALADEAYLLWGLEEYGTGLPIAERALAIRSAAARETAELAASRYQAADFRRATGDLAGALEGYRGAIAVWTRLFGPDHVENGSAWHYIGVLHGIAGDPERARAALERALRIRERGLGPNDALVAHTLQGLAHLAARGGDGAAEPLFARAQRIWEKTLGPRDPAVARSLLSRASLRVAAGDPAGARPLLDRALSIRLQAFGPRHYLVAQARRVRADLLAREGDFAAAAVEAEAALDILRASLGPVHPEVASALADRARLLWSAGRRADAFDSALAAERMAREQFLRSSRDLDDALALRHAAARTSGLDVLLTALAQNGAAAGPAVGAAADLELSAAAREAIDALIRSRGMVLGPARRARSDAVDAGLEEVGHAVPPGSALVAYARYRRVGGIAGPGEPSYLAVVVRPGSVPPAILALGPAAVVDASVESWRAEATRDPIARGGPDPEAMTLEAGDRLRRRIWDPLAPAIGAADRVFIVPDGAVDLVPFAALPDGADRFLAETGPLFHYLTAERDLVVTTGRRAVGRGVLSIGGPRFDAMGRATAPAGGAGAIRPLCPEFGALSFEPLPGAAEEAR